MGGIMKPSISTLGFVLVFTMSALSVSSQLGQQLDRRVLLDSRADMATDGKYLYAVAVPQHLIVRTLVAGPRTWEALPVSGAFGEISGLAGAPGALFVVDSKGSRLAKIDTSSGDVSRFSVVFSDLSLKQPEGVAAAGGEVFVADSGQGEILRIRNGTNLPRFLSAWMEPRPGLRLFLSGNEDSLLVGRTDGSLLLAESVQIADKTSPQVLQRASFAAVSPNKTSSIYQRVLGEDDMRAGRPISGSLYKGLVYLVDATERGVSVFERSTRRSLHIDDPIQPILGAARILATDRTLFVLTFEGTLREFERPVPAEIVSERADVPQLIPRLYSYLRERHLLATRRVQVVGSLDDTLRRSKLLGGSIVKADVHALVCDLNPRTCPSSSGVAVVVPELEWLNLPDWDASSYVDQRRVMLSGERSLADELDRRIVSPEFSAWKNIDKIRELNLGTIPAQRSLADVRTGTFYLPTELIRYLVPVPRSDANFDFGLLSTLPKIILGLRLRSLEPVSSSGVGAGQPPTNEWVPLAEAHDKMLATIKATKLSIQRGENSPAPKIGIAELGNKGFIDRTSPDFGPDVFIDDQMSAGSTATVTVGMPASSVGPASQPPPTAVGKAWRAFLEDTDHGTAVASLIGATKFKFDKSGLAVGVPLMALHKDEPDLDKDIANAFLQSGVRIFNLSFTYKPGEQPTLRQAIINYPQALFVVAAGNSWTNNEDEGKICEGNLVIYPACDGDKPNVIVVTATDLPGAHLVAAQTNGQNIDPGVNWHPMYVHLAAPGDGFYASGYQGGYVPVRGSSFAAPLVTAVAAALYAEGVTNPVLIKQRLIATADRVPTLTRYIQGGLLNAERALAWPTKGVVTEGGNPPRPIGLQPSNSVTIPAQNGTSETVPASYIRRVTRVGAKVRVVYAMPSQPNLARVDVPELLRVVEISPGNWPIKYREFDKKTFQEIGPKKELNLGAVNDYVGPILP
jgi:hypothetical protein